MFIQFLPPLLLLLVVGSAPDVGRVGVVRL